MSESKDLNVLLSTLNPVLQDEEYVFLTRPIGSYGEGAELAPVLAFTESEGLTLVVPKRLAEESGEAFSTSFRMITLQVHSNLEAVGLTAAVAGKLTEKGISANVVAAFHHDHIFVPAERAADAIAALMELQS